jgi:hypothetical protein
MDMKTIKSMNTITKGMTFDMLVLLKTRNIKDKDKAADTVSYLHTGIVLNILLSFWYTNTIIHCLNLTMLMGIYTDWFYNGYAMVKYNSADECVLTRFENVLRSEAVRERNYIKKALEVKEKPKLKNGYIKTVIYNYFGTIVPTKWVDVCVYGSTCASLYNTYLILF